MTTAASLDIRAANRDDAAEIAAIYNVYARDSIATFELADVDVADMAARIERVQEAGLPWLVACRDHRVCGYAYAAPWKPRAAYARTAESSIYLAREVHGLGIGKRLYGALIERVRAAGVHALIGGVALPNPASIVLHEALGFVQVAHFRETGFKFGRWIDVGYWQRVFVEPA